MSDVEDREELGRRGDREGGVLSIEEKRRWLAAIVRNTSGEMDGHSVGLGDKFKALVEDNKLAAMEEESGEGEVDRGVAVNLAVSRLVSGLLETITPPHKQLFGEGFKSLSYERSVSESGEFKGSVE